MLWSLNATIVETTPWHAHEVYEVAVCRQAGGRLVTQAAEVELLAGRTYVIAPDVRHRHLVGPGERADLKLICVPCDDVGAFLSPGQAAQLAAVAGEGVSVADHGADTPILALCDLIVDSLGSSERGVQQVNWSVLGLLLSLHFRGRPAPATPDRYAGKIQEITIWIDENLGQDASLDRAAAHFGMSRSLLIREFRRQTGASFVEYCNTRRVQRAAGLLASTSIGVTEVALDSGFGNLSHFHRQFKASYGMTPAAFRRKLAEEGGLSA